MRRAGGRRSCGLSARGLAERVFDRIYRINKIGMGNPLCWGRSPDRATLPTDRSPVLHVTEDGFSYPSI